MHPILFRVGTFDVHTFGLMLVIAFFASIALLRARAPRYGVDPGAISDVAFWAILGGILGARLLFIAQELPYYLKHLNELFSFKFEGLTSFGGLAGGAIAAVVVARRRGIPLSKTADLAIPAFLLGHAIGRIGCFFNGCCAGGLTAPGAWYGVPSADAPGLHYPAQLFDSAMNFAAFGAILLIERRNVRAQTVTGAALLLHGLSRFIYEFFRADTSSTPFANFGVLKFTEAHVVAAMIMLVGAGFLARGAAVRASAVRAA